MMVLQCDCQFQLYFHKYLCDKCPDMKSPTFPYHDPVIDAAVYDNGISIVQIILII